MLLETQRPRPRPVPRGRGQMTKASETSAPDEVTSCLWKSANVLLIPSCWQPALGDKYKRVMANILAISLSIPMEKDILAMSTGHDVKSSDVMEVDFDDADRAEVEDDPDADMSIEGDATDNEVDGGLFDGDDVGNGAGLDGDSNAGGGASEDEEDEISLMQVNNEREKSVDAPVAPRRYGTRASNASKHPGLIDCIPNPNDNESRGKCPKGKPAQPRSVKAKITDVDARVKANRIAALEDEIRLTEKIRDATAAHSPAGKVTAKVPPSLARRGGGLKNNPGEHDILLAMTCLSYLF